MRCGGGCWTTAESSKYFFSILLRIHRINYIFRAFGLRGECKGIIQPLILYLTPAQLSFPWYKRGVSISNVHSHKNAHNCVECSRRIDHMCECRMVEDVKWFYSHLEIKRRATIFFPFFGEKPEGKWVGDWEREKAQQPRVNFQRKSNFLGCHSNFRNAKPKCNRHHIDNRIIVVLRLYMKCGAVHFFVFLKVSKRI